MSRIGIAILSVVWSSVSGYVQERTHASDIEVQYALTAGGLRDSNLVMCKLHGWFFIRKTAGPDAQP